MKTCYKCKASKKENEFNRCARNADSLQPLCRECDNQASKIKYQKNKQYFKDYSKLFRKRTVDFINRVKSNPCMDCGKTFHPICMDFDHIGEKEFNVSQAKYLSIKNISSEIQKCDLVCANCHRLRTLKRFNSKPTG